MTLQAYVTFVEVVPTLYDGGMLKQLVMKIKKVADGMMTLDMSLIQLRLLSDEKLVH